jgi:hypothetical protein
MNLLPLVTELTRERISKEFDSLGPDACVREITLHLAQNNPELLDMARRCAADVGRPARIMCGFAMFYRLLAAQSPVPGRSTVSLLPRVSPATRAHIARQITEEGPEAFTLRGVESLGQGNPELLQMAHHFASDQANYLGVMQGFALMFRSLTTQAAADRAHLH